MFLSTPFNSQRYMSSSTKEVSFSQKKGSLKVFLEISMKFPLKVPLESSLKVSFGFSYTERSPTGHSTKVASGTFDESVFLMTGSAMTQSSHQLSPVLGSSEPKRHTNRGLPDWERSLITWSKSAGLCTRMIFMVGERKKKQRKKKQEEAKKQRSSEEGKGRRNGQDFGFFLRHPLV